MDTRIPKQWRLEQFLDLGNTDPDTYPVFVKPEWGQNSQGISRADNLHSLQLIRQKRAANTSSFLIQQVAHEKREFEIFVIPQADDLQEYAILSVTETCNKSDDIHPINGIYNESTYYKSCSSLLSIEQQQNIWGHLKQIGEFRIARYGVRANSIEDLIVGKFHIIEINLFVPMPLTLLVSEFSFLDKIKFILHSMNKLVKITKTIPATQTVKPIFFRKLKYAQRLKSIIKHGSSS